MGGGECYDEHYAKLVYDIERISINEQDFSRRMALLEANPRVSDSVLFGPAANLSNIAAPLSQNVRQPNQPPRPVPVQPAPAPVPIASTKVCSICSRITDAEWVKLPNCSGREHVFCVSCAERSVISNGGSLRTLACCVCGAAKNLFRDGMSEVLHNARDEGRGRVSFENGSCPFHKDLLLYFCLDCLEPICVKCQTGYHADHEFETLDTTFNNAKAEVTSMEREVKDARNDTAKQIEKALNAQTKVYQDAEARRSQLSADIMLMREELARKEAEFKSVIDDIKRKRCAKIEDYIVKLTCAVDSCDDAMVLIEQAKTTLERSNPMDFVQFVSDKKDKILAVVEMEENLDISNDSAIKRAFPHVPTTYVKQSIERMKYHDNY